MRKKKRYCKKKKWTKKLELTGHPRIRNFCDRNVGEN